MRVPSGRQERLLMVALLAFVMAGVVVVGARRADAGSPSLAVLRATGALARPVSAWPQAGHDARRSSHVAAGVSGPTSGHQRWQRSLGGAVPAGPVIGVDGSVLVGSNDGVLHARGRLLWREQLLGPGLSPAVAGNGRVYVSDAAGACSRCG